MLPPLSRRRFLFASGGACLPLPFLGSLSGCDEAGAAAQFGHPLVVVRFGSGVAQEDGEEPEQFWPRSVGPISRASLEETDGDRLVAELAPWAERLLLVRGTRFAFGPTHESHAGGGNQLLTAARPGPPTDTVMTYAMGESIDNWIARRSDVNRGEPLTLYCGRRDNYGEEVLSYRGPLELRGAESDPWRVYRRLTGTDGTPELHTSVNDLVLDQLRALSASPRLSAEDKARLDHHVESVRELELLSGRLSAEVQADMAELSGKDTLDEYALQVARLHCDLIALVLASGQARAVTLQVGDRLDNARYEINGQRLPSFHTLSHRNVAAEDLGQFATIQDMHAAVNRLHLGVFAYLLEKLDERELLDRSVVVSCSDVATGSHRYDNVPWIIAGAGDGTLRQGWYVDAGDVHHNRLLNTLLTATGHRADDGGPITDFGSEELEPGVVDEMMA
jgi:hypothetical protein